ncbi:MAG: hypothetical protein SPH73_02005, partial [Veillonella caviae]|nr:hypothetical protein [Veillonella caviae]
MAFLPSTPSLPAAPVSPLAPWIPCAPVSPLAPVSPFSPLAPVAPSFTVAVVLFPKTKVKVIVLVTYTICLNKAVSFLATLTP